MFSGSCTSNPAAGFFIFSAKACSVMRVRAAGASALTVTP